MKNSRKPKRFFSDAKAVAATMLLVLIAFFIAAESKAAWASAGGGTLVVRGQAGPSQLFPQVKVARCENLNGVRNCDWVKYLKLNQPESLPAGSYIVGFENSIYPGWVHVSPGAQVALDLVKLAVPTSIKRDAKVRVFRDFDSEVEKKKLFFIQYYMSRPLFRLSQYSFGDLYLASPGMLDVTLRLNYDSCNKLNLKHPDIEDALEICLTAMNATGWRDMSPLFKFSGRDHMEREIQKGQFLQNLVSEAGDRRQIVMRRHLVSAPMKATDFISVFPGQYRFLPESRGANSYSVTAGPIVEKFD